MSTPSDHRDLSAIAAICIMAAMADGSTDDAERSRIRGVFEGLDPGDGARALAAGHRRVLLGETNLAAEVAALPTPELRSLAYEMAVATCDADGAHDAAEGAFLERLRAALGIGAGVAAATLREADELADFGLEGVVSDGTGPVAQGRTGGATPGPEVAASPTADVDGMIHRYAILNGSLELLPQSLATMAIVPLQMKMVYRIGRAHGVTLDRGHIKEFLATAGVGMTSQVVENFARTLLGGLSKRLLGKLGGSLTRTATGAAFSFASTYALGQVAKQYYAGGRRLASVDLRSLFSRELEQGKALYATHQGAIESGARNIDPSRLLELVRGA